MSPSAFRVAHKFHVAAWTPETRLISALNSLANSISHVSLLARESDPARQDADRALKLLEAGEQILGRDVARNLSLPSYRYASQVHVASSEFPVPLTAAQRSFLSDAVKVMNAELRGHVEGSKPSYRADTSRQSQKPYAKDAFNRKSPLAGVPHARISIDVAILKDGQQFTVSWLDFERSGDTSALDFLLSADGELVIVKSDTVWGRGTRSVSARQVGLEWAKDVQRKIKNLMAGRVLKQRENDLLRQDRAKQDAEDVEREPANAQRAQQVAEKAKQLELQRVRAEAKETYGGQIRGIMNGVVKILVKAGFSAGNPHAGFSGDRLYDEKFHVSFGEGRSVEISLNLVYRNGRYDYTWWATPGIGYSSESGEFDVGQPLQNQVHTFAQALLKVLSNYRTQFEGHEAETDKGTWSVARDGYMLEETGDAGEDHSQGYIAEVRVFNSKSKALAYAKDIAPAYLVPGTQMWNEPVGQIEEEDRPVKYKLIQAY
jgi:hypothetical protein